MRNVSNEKIVNYAYKGFYITQTAKGFLVETSKSGRARVHVSPSFIGAKAWVEEHDSDESVMREVMKQRRNPIN